MGLPTLSVEFNATGGYTYGAYHSNYDTRFFTERVADPEFRRGVELVRLLGTIALRLGEAQVLAFRFSHYATRLDEYVAAAAEWPVDERLLIALRGNCGRIPGVESLERGIDSGLTALTPG